MVIVRIWEGLGNQLFQYAYARALQQRTQMPVYLDIRHNNRGDFPYEEEDTVIRKLGICNFNISLKGIRINKISALNCIDGAGACSGIQYYLLRKGLARWKLIDDKTETCSVKADLLSPAPHTYVNAHCVNKGYYEDYRDILLEELRLKKELKISTSLNEILETKNTVSIHIRLTDYLKNPSAICGQLYYDSAMQYIKEKVFEPYFIVFTDDYELAQKKYSFKGNTYWVSKDGYEDYEELMIMSKCTHNIIARSTFSYWGAWLNKNPGKIVVAPRQIFGGGLYEKGWKIV